MKWKNTLILIAVALGLGAYIYFVEIKKAEKDEKAKENAEKILDFDNNQVKSFTLKSSHGEVKIEKDAQSQWQMLSPTADLAGENDVTSFLTAISSQKSEEVVAEGSGVNLKTYGLETPSMSLELYLNDGVTKKLLIGNDAAISGKLYLMVEGTGKVLFAPSGIKFQMDKAPKDFRDKRIWRKSKDDIKGVRIVNHKAGGTPVIMLKAFGNIWKIEKPLSEIADRETAAGVVATIDGLRAGEFASDNGNKPSELKKFKLDHPEMEVELFDKDGKTLGTLLIASKNKNGSYLMWKGEKSVYETFSNVGDQLNKKPDDFRDKKSVLQFAKTDVTDITVKTDMAQIHLRRSSEKNPDAAAGSTGYKWFLDPVDTTKEVNMDQVENFLSRLLDLKISEFLNTTSKKIDHPKGDVELKDDKGAVLLSLQWGDKTPSGKAILAITGKAEKVFGIDQNLIAAIPVQTLIKDKAAPETKESPGKK